MIIKLEMTPFQCATTAAALSMVIDGLKDAGAPESKIFDLQENFNIFTKAMLDNKGSITDAEIELEIKKAFNS